MATVLSAATNVAASAGRSSGSLARPAATSGRTGSGTASTGTGWNMCWYSSACAVSPWNGGRPVRHSKNVAVAAYTSPAGLLGSPENCSGGAYASVPPAARSPDRAAIPKSVSLLAPSASTSTLSGL